VVSRLFLGILRRLLFQFGEQLVELHGQHGHTALSSTGAQRAALDLYGGVDLSPLVDARLRERELVDEIAGLGGDERQRLRELELYKFQVEEIEAAAIVSASEDDELRELEELLAGAATHRDQAERVAGLLGADGAADAALAEAAAAFDGVAAFEPLGSRVRDLAAEIIDPRACATSEIAAVYRSYPHIGPVLPAVGYGEAQRRELERTIGQSDAEVVVAATPIDLGALLRIDKPVVRARYDYADAGEPKLSCFVDVFLARAELAAPVE